MPQYINTMAEENQEKLRIRLHVYDTEIPVNVRPQDEPYYRDAAQLITSTVARLPFTLNTKVGVLSFKANPLYAMPTDRSLKVLIVSPKMAGAAYAKSMSISQTSKTTTIAELVIKDAVPMRAVDYLRQLSVCYNRQANEDKNEIAIRTERFINSRLEKMLRDY